MKKTLIGMSSSRRLFPSWEFGKLSDVGLTVNEVDKTEEEQTKRVCEVYRTFLDAAFEVIHAKKSSEKGRKPVVTSSFGKRSRFRDYFEAEK